MRTGAGIAGLAGGRPTRTKANGPSLPQLLSLSPLTQTSSLRAPHTPCSLPVALPTPTEGDSLLPSQDPEASELPRAHRGPLLSAPAAFHPQACGEGRDLGESQGRVRGQGVPGGINTR